MLNAVEGRDSASKLHMCSGWYEAADLCSPEICIGGPRAIATCEMTTAHCFDIAGLIHEALHPESSVQEIPLAISRS